MKKQSCANWAVLLGILVFQPVSAQQHLFNNKNLDGWDTYIGPAYDTVKNTFDTLHVAGLNKDPNKVFSVVTIDGKPAIRISGQHFGGISTQQAFSNYHLTLEFKWGKKKWHPRKDKKRDSGLLYHAVGKHGADFGFWMRSQEFQVQEGDCGDYWGVAGGSFEVSATKNKEGFIYDRTAPKLVFNGKSPNGRWCIKLRDAEIPNSWNTLEIYCIGDTAVHVVNRVVVMILNHSSQWDNGQLKPLDRGKIQIQSEGAEVYYRNIQVEIVTKVPAGLLQSN
jgi:hypothetical protein